MFLQVWVKDVEIVLFQPLEVSLGGHLVPFVSLGPRTQSSRGHTTERNKGMTDPGSTLPPAALSSLLAVINSSIPLVPISYSPSWTPLAAAPLRKTSSSTMPCFAAISDGMLSWRFDEIKMGKDRSMDVTLSSVARWERVWLTWDVCACVGGRRSGKGPRRRALDNGPWVLRWSSSVGAAGGIVRFLAYQRFISSRPDQVTDVIWCAAYPGIDHLAEVVLLHRPIPPHIAQ